MAEVLPHEPLVAVVAPKHAEPAVASLDRGRGDDCVDTGRRATADEDGEGFRAHTALRSSSRVSARLSLPGAIRTPAVSLRVVADIGASLPCRPFLAQALSGYRAMRARRPKWCQDQLGPVDGRAWAGTGPPAAAARRT